MRTPLIAALAVATAFALPAAQAQTIKAKGASAAGVCAGALELAAGMTARAGNKAPAAVVNMQRARDFFAEMPQFDRAEIAANAEGFIRFMSERTAKATTDAQRTAISKETLDIARNCFRSVEQYARRPDGAPNTAAAGAQPQPVTPAPAPVILDAQPLPVQPLETQPLIVNPAPQ